MTEQEDIVPKKPLSRLQRLRQQGRLLDEIMAWKRQEVARVKRERPLAELRALATTVPGPLDFTAALRQPGVRLIAEIKRASPSKGLLCHDFNPETLARVYLHNGAAAISVLTDVRFFQGNLAHLTQVKETVTRMGRPVPVLRKDFIFDPYQVWEARVAGADAVLLIVAVLGDRQLRDLLAETRRLGMEALVEVHNEQELARALTAGARVVGINNRDLRTFTVDLGVTERLRPLVPPDVLVVSESGIHSSTDVQRLTKAAVDAILVGESLVKARPEVRARKVRELVEAGQRAQSEGVPGKPHLKA